MAAENRRPSSSGGRSRALRLACTCLYDGERIDMSELARKAEVNRTTLYRWFGSRDQLIADALWDLADRTITRQDENLPVIDGPRTPRLLADHARIVIGHPGIRAFIEREPSSALELLTGRKYRYHTRLVARIRELLERDEKAGLLSSTKDVPIDDLAYTAARVLESYAHSVELTGEPPNAEAASRVLLSLLR